MKALTAVAVGLVLFVTAGAADADPIVVWEFNLPSTSVASQSPPYPTVATLTLTQGLTGVEFLLDPNESIVGAWKPATSRTIAARA